MSARQPDRPGGGERRPYHPGVAGSVVEQYVVVGLHPVGGQRIPCVGAGQLRAAKLISPVMSAPLA